MSNDVVRSHYGSGARFLHWITVLLVVVAWTMGRFGEQLFDEAIDALHKATATGFSIHLWAGLAVLAVAMLRFPWRIANPPPPPEVNELNRWLIFWTDPTARLTHYALYILLFLVPITGILLQFFEGHTLSLFGLAEVAPSVRATSRLSHIVRGSHELLAYLLVVVSIFHATAAVLHHVVFRDKTLVRMMPWLRSDDPKTR